MITLSMFIPIYHPTGRHHPKDFASLLQLNVLALTALVAVLAVLLFVCVRWSLRKRRATDLLRDVAKALGAPEPDARAYAVTGRFGGVDLTFTTFTGDTRVDVRDARFADVRVSIGWLMAKTTPLELEIDGAPKAPIVEALEGKPRTWLVATNKHAPSMENTREGLCLRSGARIDRTEEALAMIEAAAAFARQLAAALPGPKEHGYRGEEIAVPGAFDVAAFAPEVAAYTRRARVRQLKGVVLSIAAMLGFSVFAAGLFSAAG